MQIKEYLILLTQNHLITNTNIKDDFLNTEIAKVSYNSKDVVSDTLFICKGLKYKEEYLLEAISHGAICYIAEEKKNVGEDFPYIIVSDIRKALALVSALFYNNPTTKINMIGLTGTKGKSTTAYYIKSILDNYMESIGQKDTAIISYGPVIDELTNAFDKYTIVNAIFQNPIDIDVIKSLLKYKTIVVYDIYGTEEGFASLIRETLDKLNYDGDLKVLAVPNAFIKHGSVAEQRVALHLTIDDLMALINKE